MPQIVFQVLIFMIGNIRILKCPEMDKLLKLEL